MIIKGGSRGAPTQLAWHLQRRDTNEAVEILELQSPAPNLKEAFRDWQTLVEGTRGVKGLYHANIDPAQEYTLTPEQWRRSVEVLEKELGLEGQPRAIVKHEKHGRAHIHVVWARTDIDRMVLRSDSQNYLAHERASKALEMEFGHKPVPGKHAKRDRDKQPEFPRAEADQPEWQQGERTNLDPAARKDQITILRQTCDNGQAFKTALEEQGYILAKGDRRDFVIVDQAGSIHSLGRQIRDMKAADLRAFMKDVDREALPTATEAKELQNQQPVQSTDEEAQRKETELWAAYWQGKFTQHARELERMDFFLEKVFDFATEQQLDAYVTAQREEMDALKSRIREETSGIEGYLHATRLRWNPQVAAEETNARRLEIAQLRLRQQQELKDYRALLEQNKELELEELRERPVRQLLDDVAKARAGVSEDLDRYLREAERHRQISADFARRRREDEEEKRRNQQQAVTPQQSPQEAEQRQIDALKKAVADRQVEERRRLVESQAAELSQLREAIDRDTRDRLERFDAIQHREAEQRKRQQAEERPTGLLGVVSTVRDLFAPGRVVERQAERRRQDEQFAARQKQERNHFEKRLRETNASEIGNLSERHAMQLQDHTTRGQQELARHLREREAAIKLRAEFEEDERRRELERNRDGPERPPPKRVR